MRENFPERIRPWTVIMDGSCGRDVRASDRSSRSEAWLHVPPSEASNWRQNRGYAKAEVIT